jgi:hypothetical protein
LLDHFGAGVQIKAVQLALLDHYEQYSSIDASQTAAAMAKLPIRTRTART